ncbi:PH domain-containing protein [Blastococcus goldschmidtiae]|uniref:PH domain-containing protein n=1 Tax=Blastococcus goldschmidtiae TaxID=3075546 RepID=A0ABU2KAZ0_9ACTN|nr:PH domain-containing protein [Blastococcus sp. DSM 46792]MDT0277323.1 PH domain-containing protein [Blastococcus sp. DSM 46792]
MADAAWLPDPAGAHELRYWNGSAWTEHVSDQGTQGQDPPPSELPAPAAAMAPPPVPPPPAAASPGLKLGWKDRLKQVADQGKAMVEQGKQKLAEQNAKRTEQWANDPTTLWFGESRNAATSATGVAKARYRITKDRVWIESGLLGTRTESVPLWSIKDMDVRQAVWQRGNDIGDVVLVLEDAAYGASTDMFDLSRNVEGTTTGQVVLDDVEGPYAVLDLLAPLVSEARSKKTMERQSTYVHNMTPGVPYGATASQAAPAPAPPPQIDMVE